MGNVGKTQNLPNISNGISKKDHFPNVFSTYLAEIQGFY